jgi:asparagine synthase (glutamine-hydrolysing)
MKIKLQQHKWENNGRVWATGFIISGEQRLVNHELLDYFNAVSDLTEFIDILRRANGQFSVIIKSAGEIWAATDRLRNYPLFYSSFSHGYVISDDCYELTKLRSDPQYDNISVKCFLSAGYVINNNTLIKDVFQVEAGSYIVLGENFKSGFYYNPDYLKIIEMSSSAASEELKDLIYKIFSSHFKFLQTRFIAIPLSGGFDSRLVAAMCARFHPDNVLCYTYGAKNNPEVAPAKEVAKRMGLNWINIIYDSELIKGFLSDDTFKKYYPCASNLSSMFFMQDYFAVKYLHENKLVPDDTVFIPGISGDMLAGSHLVPEMKKRVKSDKIAEMIFKEFFGLVRLNNQEESDIRESIMYSLPAGKYETWKVTESWDRKERQAKFIVNSARIYSYFGYEYVIPLWDNRLIDFFSDLPFVLKHNKKLYDYVLTQNIFKELNLNLKKELNPLPVEKALQRFKEKAKFFLPDTLRDRLIDIKSPILYDEITRLMLDDIGERVILSPRQANYYNSYITQWYLSKTSKLFNIR